ncbi:YihY/virulence factor BrkB family protein [Asticcacaulis sp. EMRT-3]|uniref:YihY/virulence factor BrkB family protein n=1 Tax=Asticcacaulis sp. EMRT-3 TaxID=3040349 RepID=UPI0024AF550A|nr:YihY/virulence factor BrkB family protein [Asticcacaulis sp. EMRT-3]MDI7774824.1 YihY/virulence factor BrkB family protein [Asticcacaulis sp. EMRT-3]
MTDIAEPRHRLNLTVLWLMLKETLHEWNEDKVPRLGAALAFYSVLSIGPLLLIVIAIASLFFGHEAVAGYLVAEIQAMIGERGAHAIQSILRHRQHATDSQGGGWATAIGLITLLISSTGFFAQLQDALNTIWNVDHMPRGHWIWFVKKRLLSFAMILGVGLILLVGLVISALLAAFTTQVSSVVPSWLLHLSNTAFSFCVAALMFAMVYKFLPDVNIKWRDVGVGAIITAILFETGKFLISLYLSHSAFGTAYGAAGSLIVLLVWIYYSTQVFFLGAEFTQVYARFMGEEIVLKKGRRKTSLKSATVPTGRGHEVINIAKTSKGAHPAEPKL